MVKYQPKDMIPLVDLTREYETKRKQIDLALKRVLQSGNFLSSREVASFEKEFASYLKIPHVIGVGSGTDAIALALQVFNIGKRDEVIVPANVYPSVFGVLKSGASPIISDIDPKTLNLEPKYLKSKISKKTKAILFVHLYGNPAGITRVANFAKNNKLTLIEDCSHAQGAKANNRYVGAFGDVGCFSFYPTKNLSAYGDAGALVTKDSSVNERIRFLLKNGEKSRFVSSQIGLTSRLDEIQAGVLRVKLKYLEKENNIRAELVNYYKELLIGLPLKTQKEELHSKHVFLNFILMTNKRNHLLRYLRQHKIEADIHYPVPLHLQPSLQYLDYKKGDFPNAEKICDEILTVPMYPYLRKTEVNRICQVIRRYFQIA